MNIEFRKVVIPDENEALCAFDRIAFAQFPADLFEKEEWAEFESHWMIVDGKTVGCSAFVHDVDFDETSKPGYLWIASTGVLPDHQGKGFGRMLKEWQIDYAKQHGFTVIVTNMRQSNSRIIKLNEKLGFTIREVVPEYYPDPTEDAIVMELKLFQEDAAASRTDDHDQLAFTNPLRPSKTKKRFNRECEGMTSSQLLEGVG